MPFGPWPGTGGGGGGGGVTSLTSAGGTIAITNPAGPVVNVDVVNPFPGFGGAPPAVALASSAGVAATAARSDHTHAAAVLNIAAGAGITATPVAGTWTIAATGTSFPGFGGAPPTIAGTSSAGAAGTASRSDHTHGLDLVAYTPSAAGMQAAGVVQQAFAAGTGTPSVLTMTAANVPFGAAGGVLTQDAKLQYLAGASNHFVISKDSAPPAAGNIAGVLTVIVESASTAVQLASARASAIGSTINWQKARGTWAAPAAALASDVIGFLAFSAYDGATFFTPLDQITAIPSDGTIAVGNVSMAWGIQVNAGAGIGSVPDFSRMPLACDTDRNAYLGYGALTGASVDGFVYMAAVAGAPSGVPTRVFGNAARATNRTPTMVDNTDHRYYAYMGGAWHFAGFYDLTPVTNQVPFANSSTTLTSSPMLTFDGAGSLVVGDTTGSALLDLRQVGGGGNVQSSTGDLFLAGNPGVNSTTASVRMLGGVGVDSVRVYQDMVSFFGNGAASATLTQNVIFFDNRPALQGGRGTIFIHNRSVTPTGNPANGGYMWADAGELFWRSSGGTVNQLTPILAVANGAVVVALGAFGPAGSSATPTRWMSQPDGAGGVFTVPSFT